MNDWMTVLLKFGRDVILIPLAIIFLIPWVLPLAKQSYNYIQSKIHVEAFEKLTQVNLKIEHLQNNQHSESQGYSSEDILQIVSLLTKSAEMGLPEAQYKLAVLYSLGIMEIEPNRILCYRWMLLAKGNGHPEADEKSC